MVIFSSWIKLSIFSSTALADFVAGFNNGRAMPMISAPKIRALAMSIPVLIPPLPIIVSSLILLHSIMASVVGIPHSKKVFPNLFLFLYRKLSIKAQDVPPRPPTSMVLIPAFNKDRAIF